MPTTNKDMGDMLRKKRDDLGAYMYEGGPPETPSDGPDAVILAKSTEPLPETEETSGLQVLDPGQPDPPDKYVYAQGDAPGSWVMYPPGVPCDTETTRVALDHPATVEDLTAMDEAVGAETTPEAPYEDEEMEVA